MLKEILERAAFNESSDVHLSAGSHPILRVCGKLKMQRDFPALTQEAIFSMLKEILTPRQIESFVRDLDFDTGVDIEGHGRFRVNIFVQKRGVSVVFRLIPSEIKSIDELGMPETLRRLVQRDRGLILVVGPTGCGKSTTLAAMIDEINQTREDHIITIEDPIEFVHSPKKCLVNQRETGLHTKGFANAMRAALREDPDVILVGEMRDLATIRLALTAAETGHLVLATLHTSSAPKTVDRIVNVFPSDEQDLVRMTLADSLLAVVCQTLLPRIDGLGRVPAFEIMVCVPGVRNLIREMKIHQIPTAIQTGAQFGMITLDQSLKNLVRRKIVDREVAQRAASNPALI